jgi:hypothetical protein
MYLDAPFGSDKMHQPTVDFATLSRYRDIKNDILIFYVNLFLFVGIKLDDILLFVFFIFCCFRIK